VKFRITRHSGYAAPSDALELLLRRLGARREEVSFTMVGSEIRARWGDDDGDRTTRETKAEIGRWEVFEMVRDVCERSPELETDWFAVSYMG